MKSTVLLGLTLGLFTSALMIFSVEIFVSNSYAPLSDSTKLGLANRFNTAADEIEDRGNDAGQNLRDKADELDEPPVDIKVELRNAAGNVEDHTSDAARNLRDKANELLEPTN